MWARLWGGHISGVTLDSVAAFSEVQNRCRKPYHEAEWNHQIKYLALLGSRKSVLNGNVSWSLWLNISKSYFQNSYQLLIMQAVLISTKADWWGLTVMLAHSQHGDTTNEIPLSNCATLIWTSPPHVNIDWHLFFSGQVKIEFLVKSYIKHCARPVVGVKVGYPLSNPDRHINLGFFSPPVCNGRHL